jgi:DNA-binding beta-propeller fold protein YncE
MVVLAVALCLPTLVAGAASSADIPWVVSAKPLRVLTGFQVPESVVCDPATGLGYVSNIVGKDYWGNDGSGYVTRLRAGGEVDVRAWRRAAGSNALQGPKGLGLLNGWLYVADNGRLRKLSLTSKAGSTIQIPGAKNLNDVAIDGNSILVTDSITGKLHRVSPDGRTQKVLAVIPGINGVTLWGKRMFAVSWDKHEVYEVDPGGDNPPRILGLASHFKNLDGIEALADGTLIVSDFFGNKVCAIATDRKTVKTLITIDSPADIGLDRKRGLLYVPQFLKDKVAVYSLKHR